MTKVETKGKHVNGQPKRVIPWEELEIKYTTENVFTTPWTAERLGKKYGINAAVIYNYMSKDNWTEKREKFKRECAERARKQALEATSIGLSKVVINTVKNLIKASSDKELHTHEEVNGLGELIKYDTDTVRINKLVNVSKILSSLQRTEIEKIKIELEREKLKKEVSGEEKIAEYFETLLDGIQPVIEIESNEK